MKTNRKRTGLLGQSTCWPVSSRKQAIELNPNLFEAYYYYARTKLHRGDMVAAANLFDKAAKADPADYQSRCLRGQILRGSGRLEEARIQALITADTVISPLRYRRSCLGSSRAKALISSASPGAILRTVKMSPSSSSVLG